MGSGGDLCTGKSLEGQRFDRRLHRNNGPFIADGQRQIITNNDVLALTLWLPPFN